MLRGATAIGPTLETDRLHAIDPMNHSSRRVAERLGSRVLPAPLDVAVEIWGQTRSEWLRRSR